MPPIFGHHKRLKPPLGEREQVDYVLAPVSL